MKNPFKKGTRVKYVARIRTGRGTVTGTKQTVKGPWFQVKTDEGGDTLSLRAAGLQAI